MTGVGLVAATLLSPLASAGGGSDGAATGTPRAFTFRQVQMGGEFRLKLYAADEPAANRAAAAVGRRVKALSAALSDYHPGSELNRLCDRYAVGEPERVSDDLFAVLAAARRIGAASGGAFDVTVAPLVRLWRIARRRGELPDPRDLAAARSRVGWDRYTLDPAARTVTFTAPDVRLDFGGIAKGYAADAALAVLREHGVTSALIDAGGDLRLGDPPPDSDGWRIGLASLAAPDAPPTRFVTLSNCAVATSGDAYRAVEIDGVRYSHIVDPHTGLGLTERSSVTVIAPDGTTADALASAVSVLGPERGLRLLDKSPLSRRRQAAREQGARAACRRRLSGDGFPGGGGAAARIVTATDGGFRVFLSPDFPPITRSSLEAPRPRPAARRSR